MVILSRVKFVRMLLRTPLPVPKEQAEAATSNIIDKIKFSILFMLAPLLNTVTSCGESGGLQMRSQ